MRVLYTYYRYSYEAMLLHLYISFFVVVVLFPVEVVTSWFMSALEMYLYSKLQLRKFFFHSDCLSICDLQRSVD